MGLVSVLLFFPLFFSPALSAMYTMKPSSIVPQPGMSTYPQTKETEEPVRGIPLYSNFESPETKRFVVDGFQDVWAALLFIATMFMTFVWGIVNYSSDLQSLQQQLANSTLEDPDASPDSVRAGTLVGVTFLLVAVGAALAMLSLSLMSKYPEKAIIAANVGAAALNIIAAVIAFATGVVVAGALLLICGALQLLWLYLVRARIPFSALLLKNATQLVQRYKAVILVNFGLVACFTAYMLFWSAMIYPYMNRSVQTEEPSPKDGGLSTLFLFLILWTSQVVFNVMHVTACGLAATWYFVGTNAMPPNPTSASFKRAITTSFGSICFGSMLVAIVKLLRMIAESQRKNENTFVACVFECLLACLERLIEYFNTYAFVHVAIYGCSYMEAAHRTWELAKNCFFAAYFNDALVGTTCVMIALGMSGFVGVITAVAAANVGLGIIVFIVVFCVHTLVFKSLESFVVTLFVCFAQHPQALQVTSPELHAMLTQADTRV